MKHKSLHGREQSQRKCEVCGKVFAYQANLVQHMKCQHLLQLAVEPELEDEEVDSTQTDGILMF
jgi:hypothetical protein